MHDVRFYWNSGSYGGATKANHDTGTSYNSPNGWQRDAECSTAGLDPAEAERRRDLFALRTNGELRPFGFDAAQHPKVAEALSFCERCPVRRECGEYAREETDYPLVGVWGGAYVSWREALANLADAHRTGRKVRNTRRKFE